MNDAREQIAALVGVQPAQLIFTSGGTESNNAFIKGAAGMLKPSQLAVSAIEHPCVAKPARSSRAPDGSCASSRSTPLDVSTSMMCVGAAQPTGIVSVMLANNETGVIQDVAAIAELARAARAWVHTDAVQALGKIRR